MVGKESNKKILLAEDEKAISNALTLKLKKSGYNVTQAFDGQEAIDHLSKGKFDLVLLDIMMPKVDGYGVLGHIKDNKIKTSVIVLSNLSQQEDVDRVKALGAKDFFVKSNTSLVQMIELVENFFSK